jgi:hypothetical protein
VNDRIRSVRPVAEPGENRRAMRNGAACKPALSGVEKQVESSGERAARDEFAYASHRAYATCSFAPAASSMRIHDRRMRLDRPALQSTRRFRQNASQPDPGNNKE